MAKQLILNQYEYAKQERKNGEPLLYKMCHGIWLKLQYTHQMRYEKRQLAKNNMNAALAPAAEEMKTS